MQNKIINNSNNFNSFLKWSIIVGIFITFVIPFVVPSNMFFPFITGKNFMFRVIVEVIFALWVILALKDASYRPQKQSVLVSLAAFVGLMGISAIMGENAYKSFWSNFERMEGWITLIHLLAYTVVLGTVFERKNWVVFLNSYIAVSLALSIYGFMQYSGVLKINQGSTRLDATLGNATYLAIFMLFNFFFALYLWVKACNKNKENWINYSIIYAPIIIIQFTIIYLTATRGTMLGLLGGLILASVIILLFEKEDKILKNISTSILSIVLIILFTFPFIKNTNFVQNSPVLSRFASISINESKTQARGFVWPMALKGFQEKPIFGWGQENFNYVFNKYYDPRMYNHEQWFDRTHNVFLDWLVEGGVFGFLSYLAILLFLIISIWKMKERSVGEKAVLIALVAGYCVHNVFVFDNLTSYMLFAALLAYVYSENKSEIKIDNKKNFIHQDVIDAGIAPLIIVLTIFIVYFVNYKPYMANINLIKAIAYPTEKFDSFKKAFELETFAHSELVEQSIQNINNLKSGLTPEKAEEVNVFIKKMMDKQLVRSGNDSRYTLFQGSFYESQKDYDKALASYGSAIENSPKKIMLYSVVGNMYMQKGDYENAYQYFKKAFELERTYDDARLQFAVSAVLAKHQEEADQVAIEKYGTRAYPEDRMLSVYVIQKDLARAEEVAQAISVKDKKPDAMMKLVGYYYQNKDTQNTVKMLQRIGAMFPELKTVVDNATQNIREGKPIQ